MIRYKSIQAMLLAAGLLLAITAGPGARTASAAGGDYPARPITFLVAFGAGGGTDVFARTIAVPMSEILGQPIVINNITGSAGGVGTMYVHNQPADGYTVLAIGSDMPINDALSRSEVTHKNFVPVARVQQDQSIFWVKKGSRFTSMKQLVAYAKENPGKLTFGITSPAGYDETVTNVFKKEAGINIVIVPFNSGSETQAALLGGHIDVLHEEPSAARALFEAGEIVPLVVMTEKRLPIFPDVPTAVELGYNVTMGMWRGFYVRQGTPPEIVAVLEAAVQKAMKDPRYADYEKSVMLDQRPGFMTSAELTEFTKREYETYYTILKELGY